MKRLILLFLLIFILSGCESANRYYPKDYKNVETELNNSIYKKIDMTNEVLKVAVSENLPILNIIPETGTGTLTIVGTSTMSAVGVNQYIEVKPGEYIYTVCLYNFYGKVMNEKAANCKEKIKVDQKAIKEKKKQIEDYNKQVEEYNTYHGFF